MVHLDVVRGRVIDRDILDRSTVGDGPCNEVVRAIGGDPHALPSQQNQGRSAVDRGYRGRDRDRPGPGVLHICEPACREKPTRSCLRDTDRDRGSIRQRNQLAAVPIGYGIGGPGL